MKYEVSLLPSAKRDLEKLPQQLQKRIIATLLSLKDEPRPHGIKTLEGVKGAYRIRVGDYRIIFTIRDNILLVLVMTIGDRKEVYARKEISRIRKMLGDIEH